MKKEKEIIPHGQASKEKKKTPLKPYRKPRLEKLGDLRTLTLGVSGAPVDSSGGQINQQTVP